MAVAQAAAEIFTVLPAKNGAGKDVFSVVVKRTYDISPGAKAVRAEQTVPFVTADQYYDGGDPEWASVQYESELTPFKPAADLVVIARACSPGGKPVASMEVAVIMGTQKKTLRITGDRVCRFRGERATPQFSEPLPFTEMPMRYELAYGGVDALSIEGMPFVYPRNHIGRGVVVKNLKHTVDSLALPNIEDPEDLLTPERVILGEPDRWNAQPLPTGIGWFHKTWYPRCSYVGSVPAYIGVDDVPREAKLGLVPADQIALSRRMKLPAYDPRFGNGASLGLAIPQLLGSETIELANLSPEGKLRFSLPAETPQIALDIGSGLQDLPATLQTVLLRVDEKQCDLVWRGMLEYPGPDWLPKMKRLHAEIL